MQYTDKAKNPILEGLTFTCQQQGMAQGSRPRAQGKKNAKRTYPLFMITLHLTPYALNHIWVCKGRLALTWTQGPSRWNPNE
jgi:hypothetical protein